MANPFEKELGVPLPTCCSLGSCCKGASPSTPYHKLLARATTGDDFARGFFSIMIPYRTHQEAEAVVPGIVERSLKAAKKLDEFQSDDDIVFYRCRYQTDDNKCGVWEDRPQFCRDYPDTPFVVMAPGCAFEPWAKTCKEKYSALKTEISQLKRLKQSLADRQSLQSHDATLAHDPTPFSDIESSSPMNLESSLESGQVSASEALADMETLSLVLSLTHLYVASPLHSVYFRGF